MARNHRSIEEIREQLVTLRLINEEASAPHSKTANIYTPATVGKVLDVLDEALRLAETMKLDRDTFYDAWQDELERKLVEA